jgi:hypothetical protein
VTTGRSAATATHAGAPFVLRFTTTAQASADAHALARPGQARFDLVVDAVALGISVVLLAAGNLLGLVVAAIALVSLAGSRSHPLQRMLIALRFRDYLGRATTVTIDVDGVRFENDLASSLVPWSSVDRVRWNSRTVAFFHGRSLLGYVPSSAFASPAAQAELVAFATSRIRATA